MILKFVKFKALKAVIIGIFDVLVDREILVSCYLPVLISKTLQAVQMCRWDVAKYRQPMGRGGPALVIILMVYGN